MNRELLQSNGIAVFEDRIILEAKPPIRDAVLDQIAARCSGPIPGDLIELWRSTFGGKLDYDLRVSFGEREAAMSFRELFYPDSDGYRDLWGWIEHEAELAEEAAEERGETWSGKLDYLPFGGFEYLERYYVCVRPGPEYGAVFAWQQGLPPAWILNAHEDSSARAANDLRDFFRLLRLEHDPETASPEEHASGVQMLERLDELDTMGPAERELASSLRALLRAVIIDWRAALDDGSIAGSAIGRRLALEHAARTDDMELAHRLEESGCSLREGLAGGGTILDLALACGSTRLVRELVTRDLPMKDAIRNGASILTAELATELLRRGAEADPTAVLTATMSDHVDGALLVAKALCAVNPSARAKLISDARHRAKSQDDSAARIDRKQLASNISADEYRAQAGRYRELARRLASEPS